MLVQGLVKASHFYGKFEVIIGLASGSDRYMLKFSPNEAPVRVKRGCLVYPARCPRCDNEVTSSGCFDCGHGTNEYSVECTVDETAADSGDSLWKVTDTKFESPPSRSEMAPSCAAVHGPP